MQTQKLNLENRFSLDNRFSSVLSSSSSESSGGGFKRKKLPPKPNQKSMSTSKFKMQNNWLKKSASKEKVGLKSKLGSSREVLETYQQYKEFRNQPRFKSIESRPDKSTLNSTQFNLSPEQKQNLKIELMGQKYLKKMRSTQSAVHHPSKAEPQSHSSFSHR